MQPWMVNIIDQFGYIGIALLIALENLFPPIPSELILTFGGFMTTYTGLNVWLVALFATIGSVVGAIILYGLGRLLTPDRMEKLIVKWGKFLHLKKTDLDHAEGWFKRKGIFTVFFCRFIPIVRSLISIPAGMAKMQFGKFLFFTVLGTSIWNVVLVNFGALAGAGWEKIVRYMNIYDYIALFLILVLCVLFIFWFLKKRKARIAEQDLLKDEINQPADFADAE